MKKSPRCSVRFGTPAKKSNGSAVGNGLLFVLTCSAVFGPVCVQSNSFFSQSGPSASSTRPGSTVGTGKSLTTFASTSGVEVKVTSQIPGSTGATRNLSTNRSPSVVPSPAQNESSVGNSSLPGSSRGDMSSTQSKVASASPTLSTGRSTLPTNVTDIHSSTSSSAFSNNSGSRHATDSPSEPRAASSVWNSSSFQSSNASTSSTPVTGPYSEHLSSYTPTHSVSPRTLNLSSGGSTAHRPTASYTRRESVSGGLTSTSGVSSPHTPLASTTSLSHINGVGSSGTAFSSNTTVSRQSSGTVVTSVSRTEGNCSCLATVAPSVSVAESSFATITKCSCPPGQSGSPEQSRLPGLSQPVAGSSHVSSASRVAPSWPGTSSPVYSTRSSDTISDQRTGIGSQQHSSFMVRESFFSMLSSTAFVRRESSATLRVPPGTDTIMPYVSSMSNINTSDYSTAPSGGLTPFYVLRPSKGASSTSPSSLDTVLLTIAMNNSAVSSMQRVTPAQSRVLLSEMSKELTSITESTSPKISRSVSVSSAGLLFKTTSSVGGTSSVAMGPTSAALSVSWSSLLPYTSGTIVSTLSGGDGGTQKLSVTVSASNRTNVLGMSTTTLIRSSATVNPRLPSSINIVSIMSSIQNSVSVFTPSTSIKAYASSSVRAGSASFRPSNTVVSLGKPTVKLSSSLVRSTSVDGPTLTGIVLTAQSRQSSVKAPSPSMATSIFLRTSGETTTRRQSLTVSAPRISGSATLSPALSSSFGYFASSSSHMSISVNLSNAIDNMTSSVAVSVPNSTVTSRRAEVDSTRPRSKSLISAFSVGKPSSVASTPNITYNSAVFTSRVEHTSSVHHSPASVNSISHQSTVTTFTEVPSKSHPTTTLPPARVTVSSLSTVNALFSSYSKEHTQSTILSTIGTSLASGSTPKITIGSASLSTVAKSSSVYTISSPSIRSTFLEKSNTLGPSSVAASAAQSTRGPASSISVSATDVHKSSTGRMTKSPAYFTTAFSTQNASIELSQETAVQSASISSVAPAVTSVVKITFTLSTRPAENTSISVDFYRTPSTEEMSIAPATQEISHMPAPSTALLSKSSVYLAIVSSKSTKILIKTPSTLDVPSSPVTLSSFVITGSSTAMLAISSMQASSSSSTSAVSHRMSSMVVASPASVVVTTPNGPDGSIATTSTPSTTILTNVSSHSGEPPSILSAVSKVSGGTSIRSTLFLMSRISVTANSAPSTVNIDSSPVHSTPLNTRESCSVIQVCSAMSTPRPAVVVSTSVHSALVSSFDLNWTTTPAASAVNGSVHSTKQVSYTICTYTDVCSAMGSRGTPGKTWTASITQIFVSSTERESTKSSVYRTASSRLRHTGAQTSFALRLSATVASSHTIISRTISGLSRPSSEVNISGSLLRTTSGMVGVTTDVNVEVSSSDRTKVFSTSRDSVNQVKSSVQRRSPAPVNRTLDITPTLGVTKVSTPLSDTISTPTPQILVSPTEVETRSSVYHTASSSNGSGSTGNSSGASTHPVVSAPSATHNMTDLLRSSSATSSMSTLYPIRSSRFVGPTNSLASSNSTSFTLSRSSRSSSAASNVISNRDPHSTLVSVFTTDRSNISTHTTKAFGSFSVYSAPPSSNSTSPTLDRSTTVEPRNLSISVASTPILGFSSAYHFSTPSTNTSDSVERPSSMGKRNASISVSTVNITVASPSPAGAFSGFFTQSPVSSSRDSLSVRGSVLTTNVSDILTPSTVFHSAASSISTGVSVEGPSTIGTQYLPTSVSAVPAMNTTHVSPSATRASSGRSTRRPSLNTSGSLSVQGSGLTPNVSHISAPSTARSGISSVFHYQASSINTSGSVERTSTIKTHNVSISTSMMTITDASPSPTGASSKSSEYIGPSASSNRSTFRTVFGATSTPSLTLTLGSKVMRTASTSAPRSVGDSSGSDISTATSAMLDSSSVHYFSPSSSSTSGPLERASTVVTRNVSISLSTVNITDVLPSSTAVFSTLSEHTSLSSSHRGTFIEMSSTIGVRSSPIVSTIVVSASSTTTVNTSSVYSNSSSSKGSTSAEFSSKVHIRSSPGPMTNVTTVPTTSAVSNTSVSAHSPSSQSNVLISLGSTISARSAPFTVSTLEAESTPKSTTEMSRRPSVDPSLKSSTSAMTTPFTAVSVSSQEITVASFTAAAFSSLVHSTLPSSDISSLAKVSSMAGTQVASVSVSTPLVKDVSTSAIATVRIESTSTAHSLLTSHSRIITSTTGARGTHSLSTTIATPSRQSVNSSQSNETSSRISGTYTSGTVALLDSASTRIAIALSTMKSLYGTLALSSKVSEVGTFVETSIVPSTQASPVLVSPPSKMSTVGLASSSLIESPSPASQLVTTTSTQATFLSSFAAKKSSFPSLPESPVSSTRSPMTTVRRSATVATDNSILRETTSITVFESAVTSAPGSSASYSPIFTSLGSISFSTMVLSSQRFPTSEVQKMTSSPASVLVVTFSGESSSHVPVSVPLSRESEPSASRSSRSTIPSLVPVHTSTVASGPVTTFKATISSHPALSTPADTSRTGSSPTHQASSFPSLVSHSASSAPPPGTTIGVSSPSTSQGAVLVTSSGSRSKTPPIVATPSSPESVTTAPSPSPSPSLVASLGVTSSVVPTVIPPDPEQLVEMDILVPLTVNVSTTSFREELQDNLARAYQLGLEKSAEARRKRRAVALAVNGNWAGDSKRKRDIRFGRFRRATSNIRAQVSSIRRSPTNPEVVSVQYNMFEDNTVLDAEQVVVTTGKLSDGELVYVMGYMVEKRPAVPQKEGTKSPRTQEEPSWWDGHFAAVIVSVVLAVVLVVLVCFIKCNKRIRKRRKQVRPEVKVSVGKEVQVTVDEKLPEMYAQTSGHSLLSIGENDHYVVPKRPVPADRPSSGETSEPAHKYRRRGKSRKSKTGKKKDAEEAENAQKEGENIEMRCFAGVVENNPRLLNNNLVSLHDRPDVGLRFLPPLVQTSLVSSPAPQGVAAEQQAERDRIIAQSGVPQTWLERMRLISAAHKIEDNRRFRSSADDDESLVLKANIERWRNKMRQREKARQEIREKERRKEEKLRSTESLDQLPRPTSTATRKKKSRRDRWKANRVATSSKSSTADSDSGEERVKRAHERRKERATYTEGVHQIPPSQSDQHISTSGQAAKSVAQDALREAAWTNERSQGIRLVAVKPRERTPERTHQQQHVRYLLSDAYPVIPVVTAPVISPEVAAHSVGSTAEFADTENVEDHVYVDIDGLDPHTPRYDEHATPRHVPAPFKSKYAFVDNAGFEGDYEVPFVFPTGLPQTTLPTPEAPGQEVTPQDLIPSSYAGRGTGRPTSAGQRPGSESSRRTRPSSARTEPMARYAPPPGYAAQYPVPYAGYPAQPGGYPAVIPGPSAYPRRHHGNRPSSAASSQATPRRSGAAEPGADPTNSFGQARAVFSRAQSQLDKMEHEAKVPDASDGPISVNDLYGHPLKAPSKPESAVRMSRLPPRQKSPRDMNQIDASAMEVAELEAQLLVSRALAKARVTKRM